MKKNSWIFLLTFGISFGLSLFGFRWREQHRKQQHIEAVRLKLETNLNHLLKTRAVEEIATVLQSNPVQEHTHVQKQLEDGSRTDELDLGAYLHQVLIDETIQRIQIQSVRYNADETIQTIVLVPQP